MDSWQQKLNSNLGKKYARARLFESFLQLPWTDLPVPE
jgi:hypothetical protein